jgi:two-component system alkaline phosphatase synthesis response regulator PhoP
MGQQGEARKPRILIADDNVQNVELLEAYLDELDCEVLRALDGEETLAVVRQHRPDLVLLDIMMPRISGFEICRQLKSDLATRHIPILMVTALNESGDVERAVQAGADDFISKPIYQKDLLHRVRALLKVRHVVDELERTLEYVSEVDQSSKPGS